MHSLIPPQSPRSGRTRRHPPKIIERIDAEIAANEQATPSPNLQPATAITARGFDTGAEPHLF
jgi:hypothetical protein